MALPTIEGLTLRAEVGRGAAGVVYEGIRDDGTQCAVKIFDSMSSNAALIASRMARVAYGGAHDITVPILAEALDGRPACIVMPFLAENKSHGVYETLNLQIHFEDYCQTEATWPFLLKLANRLAILHSARVAHGNLKPGNIFIGPNGGPLLADYASGLMPGVHRMSYSDALLYAPPEQLREPETYSDEAGYRWDVFAFGVLSYRLITGEFPRCEATFQSVSPKIGSQEYFDIEADYEGIASGLESASEISWPSDPEDEREHRRREMIEFCLNLDPMGRPNDMREVARYFEQIEIDLITEAEHFGLSEGCRKAIKRRKWSYRFATAAALTAVGLGGAWKVTQMKRESEAKDARKEYDNYEATAVSTINVLEGDLATARQAEDVALETTAKLKEALLGEQAKSEDELRSAHVTNEMLFDWLLEKGIPGLPVLQGRQVRLGVLARQIEKQLKGMDSRPGFQNQAAILRMRYAEVQLAMGRDDAGIKALEVAIAQGGLDRDDLAHVLLRRLLLVSERSPEDLSEAISNAEETITKAWPDDESPRLRGKATLDLLKARSAEHGGDAARALTLYQRSLFNFRQLAESHPETPALALTVGRAYLVTAMASEGAGSLENAALLRERAADAFLSLANKLEDPEPELEFQIASATAASAVAKWQQGQTFEAEKMAQKGVAKLSSLLAKLPKDFRVMKDLASQQGIIATSLRDEGKAAEASNLLKKGISMLSTGLKNDPNNWEARYLLASLKWNLAGILGQQGEEDSELEVGIEARDELRALLKSPMKRPQPSAVRKSLAYLCGDLGHSADLAGKRALAVSFLKESQICWQELVRDEGDKMEFREGYHWAKGKLTEMGVK